MQLICFNSTLVQLKVCVSRHGITYCRSFNSTLVQLKAKDNFGIESAKISFNSTLVQLKEMLLFFGKSHKRSFNSTLVQLKAVKNANKYTSKSMIYHPFILIFYKHLQSTFNS